ncbi:hypothetical protein RGRSB_1108 [cyanobacterium endosymbiont of Rhopalodia gibberula]|uniref:DUF3318 domain-containing protein n=1 Tax=cyanobacterium endosymbiont of Rhopalodia gibberula TaxID=1763363 RepID=UPI000DC6DBCF|nr:DUF3318 domain-containing protein [cyanobacterium endosymbiont of Rhopalodia gibberula]BBA79593.1 hypothetical protein RGRSB_1108 [cyanobacterium endosymbiont of Rhopalodia gibberula]
MSVESEIRRLLDLMPASGRMLTKIISKPQQSKVIDAPISPPWRRNSRPIYINFNLWWKLPKRQRDLLLLRATTSLIGIKWLKPNLYQGITVAGLVGLTVQTAQGDILGMIVSGGLTAIAAYQIWRSNLSVQRELDADEEAIKIAFRRGYNLVEASKNLLDGLEASSQLEGRFSLNFTELIRCQQLKKRANISPIGVPDIVKTRE